MIRLYFLPLSLRTFGALRPRNQRWQGYFSEKPALFNMYPIHIPISIITPLYSNLISTHSSSFWSRLGLVLGMIRVFFMPLWTWLYGCISFLHFTLPKSPPAKKQTAHWLLVYPVSWYPRTIFWDIDNKDCYRNIGP